MILKPHSREELIAQLASNAAVGEKISSVDLSALAAMVEHHPEDMTASVEAGMTLAAFQKSLRSFGQWLPIDPPHAGTLAIGDLLAHDFSGPRRLGYGTIRDYLIGIKVVLADGQTVKAGGKVVKNVAGYDLCKLFIGARHSLGIIVEGTFKLRPLPEEERFLRMEAESIDALETIRQGLLASRVEPIIFDAHNLNVKIAAFAAFAGSREDVAAQMESARAIGFSAAESENYAEEFWSGKLPRKISVLPSMAIRTLTNLEAEQFLVHLGNGVIHFRGGNPPSEERLPHVLMERVKQAYDPKGIFPAYKA